jgi:predicted RNase H-like HicB family nuclease
MRGASCAAFAHSLDADFRGSRISKNRRWKNLDGTAMVLFVELPPLTAIIEPGEDGWFVALCPELDIVSQGETKEAAEAMIKEAVELWLEDASDDEIQRRLAHRRVAVMPLPLSHA